MSYNFKVGDKVKCIDGVSFFLKKDEIYTVSGISHNCIRLEETSLQW